MGLVFHLDQLQAIDGDIRAGRHIKARKDLSELCRATVPREFRVSVAALARRVGLPYLGLRLLAPSVRPSGKKFGDATAKEKAEYAAGLIFVGGSVEGLEILGSLGKNAPVEAGLFTSFALFKEWEYGKAIPVLKKYVDSSELSNYQRLVGNVNLCAALVAERVFDEAQSLLSKTEGQAKEEGHSFLYGIILELAAQNWIHQRKWKEADRYLARAQEKLKDSESWEALFTRKWRAVADFLQGKSEGEKSILAIREEAVRRVHGETVRDIDRFLAIQRQDPNLLIHVYIGTPYETFRKRLLSEARFPVSIPDSYELKLGASSGPAIEIDVMRGDPGSGRRSLRYGGHVHRLFKELCHDFYQGSSLTALHARVYTGEYFNPVSTPAKMHRLFVRLRGWLKKEKIPLAIEEKRSTYRMVSKTSCILLIQERTVVTRHPLLDKLEIQFIDDKFSIREASMVLEFPTRSTLRLLEKGIEEGRIERKGKASATRYRFLKKTA